MIERATREVLIVGVGSNGGQQVALSLRRNPELSSAPVGFVDDDPRKQGMRIAGLKVLGTTDDLQRARARRGQAGGGHHRHPRRRASSARRS